METGYFFIHFAAVRSLLRVPLATPSAYRFVAVIFGQQPLKYTQLGLGLALLPGLPDRMASCCSSQRLLANLMDSGF